VRKLLVVKRGLCGNAALRLARGRPARLDHSVL
jgi:hypothetical protein